MMGKPLSISDMGKAMRAIKAICIKTVTEIKVTEKFYRENIEPLPKAPGDAFPGIWALSGVTVQIVPDEEIMSDEGFEIVYEAEKKLGEAK